jgi:DNA (cytosine-5)-methyltransferase 1
MGGRDQQYLKVTNFQGNDIANTIRTGGKGSMTDKHNWDTIKIKSATSKGYEEAIIGAFRGRYSDNISDTPTEQRLEINNQGTSNTITSVQKDNVVIETHRIRRLTPRECFRLMDFPDTFTWPVSDSQAYKQAGNSIVVNVLYKILKNLSL